MSDAIELWAENWRHRHMVARMIRREIAGRYLGSVLGLAWWVVQPILMLLVYTFAFNVVFQSRWPTRSDGGETNFIIAMFIGLIIYSLVAECLNRAPTLILGHVNYVKKVVFPLQILALVVVGSALFNAGVSLTIWICLLAAVQHDIPWTIVFLPVVLLPVLLFGTGIVWLLSSLGVFIRDLGQFATLSTMLLLFLSPIFYPMSAIPEPFRAWLVANPLTGVIEEARKVAIYGDWPDFGLLGINLLVGIAFSHLGLLWFTRMRRAFADVL